jgi:hypothetical protein
MSDEAKIIERIQKLLTLAGDSRTPEHEASTAAALAQQLLAAYNLDMASVEAALGSGPAKREEAKTKASPYEYERELWRRVAELNFCVYWTRHRRPGWSYEDQRMVGRSYTHIVLGRTVNVRTTEVMAGYLCQSIRRIAREWSRERLVTLPREVLAYKEGMASRVCDRLYERRKQEKEAREREAAERARANPSSSRALTIADVEQAEHDANMDHQYGEGWSARWRAKAAAQEEERRRALEALRAWEAANPEAAAAKRAAADAEFREGLKKREKYWERQRNKPVRAQTAAEMRRDLRAFHDGVIRGNNVGLDQQVSEQSRRALT